MSRLIPIILFTSVLPFLLSPSTHALSFEDDLSLLHSGRPEVALWQALHKHSRHSRSASSLAAHQKVFSVAENDPDDGSTDDPDHPIYKPHCFAQPLDHFDVENNVTFCQRYWVSTEFYKKGRKGGDGPVVVLDGGETSGANRLPFLETGASSRFAAVAH
jgi:hypothetical protein